MFAEQASGSPIFVDKVVINAQIARMLSLTVPASLLAIEHAKSQRSSRSEAKALRTSPP